MARRGQITLTRQGMREQGVGKMVKKAFTGEGMKLVKVEGAGKLYCAEHGKVVSVLELNNESISINGNDVLALSASLQYDIKFAKGASMLAGGLFNVRVCCDVGFSFFFLVFLVQRTAGVCACACVRR